MFSSPWDLFVFGRLLRGIGESLFVRWSRLKRNLSFIIARVCVETSLRWSSLPWKSRLCLWKQDGCDNRDRIEPVEEVAESLMYHEVVLSVKENICHAHVAELEIIPYPKNWAENRPRNYFTDFVGKCWSDYQLCNEAIAENADETSQVAQLKAKPKWVTEGRNKHRTELDSTFRSHSI